MVSSRKELATVLGQAKEEGEMLENIQGLFHPFEGQSRSDLRDLFLPALTPVLKTLIRDFRATDDLTTRFIGFPLIAAPEEAFYYLQRLRNTLAEKRRQEGKSTGAGFAERTFYPNYHWATPSAIKAMPNDLIPSSAVRAEFYLRKAVIFSPLSVILDRDIKIVYHHPWFDGALEGIPGRLIAPNPEQSSRAFLFRGDFSE